jgi:hypothetical protein
MKEIKVSIKGITPLLMHRFLTKGADAPSKRRTGVPDWKQEAELALYKNPDGIIYEPAEHLEKSIQNAAKSFKIAGKRGATYSKLVGATLEIYPDAIPHKIQAYEIDARSVVVQRARIMRYRPRFDAWELEFTIRLLDEQLPISVIKEILDQAGLYVGIGDYRPQRGGKFGKFTVTEFKEN